MRLEELINHAEIITRDIFEWQIIPHNKIVPN